ncbi:TPA: hypothetical protein N0F65_012450 [Lagenidium giganteum]|uniref:AB hydrolase-1 domain-containing protein n=1 Tax=Lagenidium giganteum TaxID=4803 RepID=A0AAV2YHP9_9STRA|nr:TPA: hypothetical protein N0F65_012450 [Lagenidium giganteum]
MRSAFGRIVTTAFLIAQAIDNVTSASWKQTDWFPCGLTAPLAGMPSVPGMNVFQCTQFDAPLCHDGVCTSEQTIKLFVKRALATQTDPTEAPNVWMLQGGPGGSSSELESSMLFLQTNLNGSVNMYTLDHRGTGRSTFLECEAAQAMTAGSPGGTELVPAEFGACFKELLSRFDNKPEAFSVTSAAKDVEYLTTTLATSAETYVYGASYGTYWTSRIMHLAPRVIKGYILDGVVAEESDMFATLNRDNLIPAKALAQACEDDSFCRSKFMGDSNDSVSMFDKFASIVDNLDNAESACADWLRKAATVNATNTPTPSALIRDRMMDMATTGKQFFIPAFLYRLNRCKDTDMTFLKAVSGFANAKNDTSSKTSTAVSVDKVAVISPVLQMDIDVSEMWTSPSPTVAQLNADASQSFMWMESTEFVELYCLYTGNHDEPACQDKELDNVKRFYSSTPKFSYKPDQYHKRAATIPDGAGVLVINGGLDFQTPATNGKQQFENLKGTNKAMVEFKYGGHCAGIISGSCGFEIIASFVRSKGDASQVDSSCLAKEEPLKFDNSTAMSFSEKFGKIITGDPFDGAVEE